MMPAGISKRTALKIMLILLSLVVLFHLLIIFQVVPYEIVWAGRLRTVDEMYAFEATSILINLLLIGVLLFKGKYFSHRIPEALLNVLLWLFVVVFSLNTVGNLLAKTQFERVVFTPLTFISAVLIWIIVRKDETGAQ